MLLTDDQVRALARRNPWSALAYLMTPNTLPTMLYLEATFATTAAQQNIEGNVPNRSCSDMLVWDLCYQVQSPTANDDNLLFKGQQDVFNAENPNILALLTIAGDCPRFTVTDSYAAIEIQARCTSVDDSVMSWFGGWVCPAQTVMSGNFINQRAFDATEVPVNVWVAMRGLTLACRDVWRRPIADVAADLYSIFGVETPILKLEGPARERYIALASPFPGAR